MLLILLCNFVNQYGQFSKLYFQHKIENERHFYDPLITHLQRMLFILFLFKQIECSEVRTKNTQIKPKIPQKSNKDPPRIIPPCSRIQREMHTNIHKEDIFGYVKYVYQYISVTMKYFEVGGVGNWERERVVSYRDLSFVGLGNGRSGNRRWALWLRFFFFVFFDKCGCAFDFINFWISKDNLLKKRRRIRRTS